MIAEYIFPDTIKEALTVKNEKGSSAAFVAGGTDLFLRQEYRISDYNIVIDLTCIDDLTCDITLENDFLSIPACSTISDLIKSKLVKKYVPALHRAAELMASPAIRNQATIGGNLINASPAADLVPPMISHGAIANIASLEGVKKILVEDTILNVNKTILAPDDVLVKISIPILQHVERSCFIKLGLREALAISVVSAAVCIRLHDEEDGQILQARIALGSVAPKAFRATKAEEIIVGNSFNIDIIEQSAKAASSMAFPISDIRATAQYRKDMVYELTKMALNQCWGENER